MNDPQVSIVIPCKNEGEHIRNTIQSIMDNSGRVSFEIIVVDDGSEDGCCNFLRAEDMEGVRLITTRGVQANRARNTGAEIAKGQILIFCDAHIFVEKYWIDKLVSSLQQPGVDAVSPGLKPYGDYRGPSWGGLTWEKDMNMRWLISVNTLTPVPVLPAGCLAIKESVFAAVGGFDQGFRVYGFEDVEFTMKLWLFGYGAFVNPEVTFLHIFRTAHPYSVSWADVHFNLLRMAILHFKPERIAKIINLFKDKDYFAEVFTDLILGSTLEERRQYLGRRAFDDDWFIQKFSIPM